MAPSQSDKFIVQNVRYPYRSTFVPAKHLIAYLKGFDYHHDEQVGQDELHDSGERERDRAGTMKARTTLKGTTTKSNTQAGGEPLETKYTGHRERRRDASDYHPNSLCLLRELPQKTESELFTV